MRRAHAAVSVPLDPARAMALWTNLSRWATFVEGFARVLSVEGDWPAPGARVSWESVAGGRGRVTERVVELDHPGRLVTDVYEDALSGRQIVACRALEDDPEAEQPPGGRCEIELTLEYELTRGGPLGALTDALFIRRALRDAQRRTLRRFAVEAEEEARL